MSIHIRRLQKEDLPIIEAMAQEKLTMTNTASGIFEGSDSDTVFKYFVLPHNVYGHDKMRAFGYFNDESKLIAVMGLRCLDNSPAWVFSFIVTEHNCKNSVRVIKNLLKFAIDYQEKSGFYQWFVVSKLEKFGAWQKLFNSARDNYHHYVYARVSANTMPKWLSHLQFSGGKLFPYDINISMYISRSLCTSDESFEFDEREIDFL
jgi:hypothetical protein